MSTVLVTGGTGLLGRTVVHRLTAAGTSVRVLVRTEAEAASGGNDVTVAVADLSTGQGLAEAVAGATTIVHCASNPRAFDQVDVAGTARLVAAARRAGEPHLVYISIVGVDRIPWAYYQAKLAAERTIERSGLPWTILRATQFHDFALELFQRLARPPVMAVPRGWRLQSIDVHDVAAHLASAAQSPAAGRLPGIGGPQVLPVIDAARAYLRAADRHRLTVQVPVPGAVAAAFRAGAHLAPDNCTGRRTWAQFLDSRYPAGRSGRTPTGAERPVAAR